MNTQRLLSPLDDIPTEAENIITHPIKHVTDTIPQAANDIAARVFQPVNGTVETVLDSTGNTRDKINSRIETVDYSVLGFLELAPKPCTNIIEETLDSAGDTAKPIGDSIPRVLDVRPSVGEKLSNVIPDVLEEVAKVLPQVLHGLTKVLPRLLTRVSLREKVH